MKDEFNGKGINALAVDSKGNVYVAEGNWVSGTGLDFITIKRP
jgi:hypothetical protein